MGVELKPSWVSTGLALTERTRFVRLLDSSVTSILASLWISFPLIITDDKLKHLILARHTEFWGMPFNFEADNACVAECRSSEKRLTSLSLNHVTAWRFRFICLECLWSFHRLALIRRAVTVFRLILFQPHIVTIMACMLSFLPVSSAS